VDIASELERDTGSHLFAAQHGYKWVASHTEIATAMIANELKRTIAIPFPMPAESDVSDAERAEVEDYYAEHSAWN